MLPVLNALAMRESDRQTIEEIGIPGFTLMESAGRESCRILLDWTRSEGLGGLDVGILCGKGNNGGDGLVLARWLADAGHPVRVLLTSGADDMSPDAAQNLQILRRMDLVIWAATQRDLEPCTILVDALLGTGQTSAPHGPLGELVGWLGRQDVPTVALDLPTGIHTDTGQVLGQAVSAALTIAMGALKTGLVLGEGPAHAGAVKVASIGIPSGLLADASGAPGCAGLLDDDYVGNLLPRRTRRGHKYTTGPALVIGGSARYPGAPALSSQSAARIGAGYVVTALPEGVSAAGPVEIPVIRHQEEEELAQWLDRAKGVLIGPGLGREPAARHLVARTLQLAACPVVIDADALHAVAELGLTSGGRPWLFTPHAGEFRRLTEGKADYANPIVAAQTWAARWNVTLLLKGSPTVIAHPDGRTVICSNGGPALATAGTGDVLAGLCVGLMAMGLEPFEAAACAAHVGGASAARYTRSRGRSSLMASDIISQIPLVLSELFDH